MNDSLQTEIERAHRPPEKKPGRVIPFFRAAFGVLRPAFWWVYLFVGFYFIIGSFLFPSWWKRVIFQRGLFDITLIKFGFTYLWRLIENGHPLGLLIPVTTVFLIFTTLYYAGQFGISRLFKSIQPPKKLVIYFVTMAGVICLIAVKFVENDYVTPVEYAAYLTRLRAQVDDPLEELGRPQVNGPKSGFFLYADVPRIAQIFSSLQEAYTLQTETTKKARELSGSSGASIGSFKVDATGKFVEEVASIKVPVTSTPERQAQFLISYFSKDPATIVLDESSVAKDSQLTLAHSLLIASGVILTPEQEKALAEARAKEISLSEDKRRVLLYTGPITLSLQTNGYKMTFSSSSRIKIDCEGMASQASLDTTVREFFTSKTNLCTFRATVLCVQLRGVVNGASVKADILPLAFW